MTWSPWRSWSAIGRGRWTARSTRPPSRQRRPSAGSWSTGPPAWSWWYRRASGATLARCLDRWLAPSSKASVVRQEVDSTTARRVLTAGWGQLRPPEDHAGIPGAGLQSDSRACNGVVAGLRRTRPASQTPDCEMSETVPTAERLRPRAPGRVRRGDAACLCCGISPGSSQKRCSVSMTAFLHWPAG